MQKGHWSNRIRTLGEDRKLSPIMVSRMTGMNYQTIRSLWYRPTIIPHQSELIEALSSLLRCKPMELIEWVGGEPEQHSPALDGVWLYEIQD